MMPQLIDVGIANAITAGILAAVVLLATKVYTNPQFARVLWLLVLVKLVTPPLWTLPVRPVLKRVEALYSSPANENLVPPAETQTLQQEHPTQRTEASTEPENSTAHSWPTLARRGQSVSWRMVVAVGWGTGSIVWLSIASFRIARFQQTVLSTAELDQSALAICHSVALIMGLRKLPRMRVSHAELGPMVWPIGINPTVLLPRTMLHSSSDDELKLLIAHEYAHLKRRDHWVRWFELFVCSVYWWHPAYWIARSRSRQAEEYCCDAVVLERMTQTDARSYAKVLLKAAEFAAGLNHHPPRLASCMGSRDSLKGRIQMILGDTTSIRLSLTASLLSLAIAIVVLPVSVAAFQRSGAKEDTSVEDDRVPSAQAHKPSVEHDEKDLPLGQASPLGVRRVALPAEQFRIEDGYILEIRVPEDNTFVDEPINDEFLVQPGGNVSLGPSYGRVHVAGLTLEEAEQAVTEHLKKILTNASATVTLGGWRLTDIGYSLGHDEQSMDGSNDEGIVISLETLRSIAGPQPTPEEQFAKMKMLKTPPSIPDTFEPSELLRRAESQQRWLKYKVTQMRRVLELALTANQVSPGSVPEEKINRLKEDIENAEARANNFTINITELLE